MAECAIAVAGAGLIGRRHIELIGTEPRCELAAIVDPAPQASALADTLGVPAYPSLGDLLASRRPDGVIVATPNRLHLPHGTTCVSAGVPVLLEKPVAQTVDEAEALLEAAEAADAPLLVGHHRRHNPILARAREVVQSGQLGQIVAVTGSAIFYKPDGYFDEGPWRREVGGGPILVNMIHEVDDLRFLCGDIESVQVTTSNRVRGFPVEDTVAMTFRFASGALGTFLLSDTAVSALSWEQTSGENKSYPNYPDEDCYVIAGTQGSLSVPTMRVRRQHGESSWWEPTEDSVVEVRRSDPLAVQLQHFCDVINRTAEPLVSGRDATESLRVTQAIVEAAATENRARQKAETS